MSCTAFTRSAIFRCLRIPPADRTGVWLPSPYENTTALSYCGDTNSYPIWEELTTSTGYQPYVAFTGYHLYALQELSLSTQVQPYRLVRNVRRIDVFFRRTERVYPPHALRYAVRFPGDEGSNFALARTARGGLPLRHRKGDQRVPIVRFEQSQQEVGYVRTSRYEIHA